MSSITPAGFDRPPHGRFVSSKWIALGTLVILAMLGWTYLGLMIAGHLDHMGHGAHGGHGGSLAMLGPGMALFDWLRPQAGLDPSLRMLIDVLCRPRFGSALLAETFGELLVAILMWVAMVLAMMLPTAAPMVAAAAGVADRAARHGEAGVAPLAVLAGYLAVWIGFAAIAALAQLGLTRLALLDAGMATASPLFAGAIAAAAGAYQFSPLKAACVANCRRPTWFFLDEPAAGAGRSFHLGVRQGYFCLGCCWAMMLMMFAVGAMNVVWMAVLGAVMAVEKIAGTPRLSRAFGALMIAAGAVTIAVAVVNHWPAT